MKYTPATLQKIEKILTENGHKVRYEKGSFQSGYCIIHQTKVIVVNKYFTVEGKINALSDIILQLEIDENRLSDESRKLFETISQTKLDL